jgi:hypothetical protein
MAVSWRLLSSKDKNDLLYGNCHLKSTRLPNFLSEPIIKAKVFVD